MARDDGTATRDLPESVSPETWFGVAIDIQPPPDVTVVVLQDEPPSGWLVRNISNSGTWDEIHGKVKWGPYYESSIPAQVTYELLPPAGVSGQYCLVGAVSFDGGNVPIEGDQCVDFPPDVLSPLPEDSLGIACTTEDECDAHKRGQVRPRRLLRTEGAVSLNRSQPGTGRRQRTPCPA